MVRENFGEYKIKFHSKGRENGNFTVFGPGIRDKGYYVPSRDKIMGLYERSGNVITPYLRNILVHRGVIIPDDGGKYKPSLMRGRKSLQILSKNPDKWENDKVRDVLLSFWPKDNVFYYLSALNEGEDVKARDFNLNSMSTFTKAQSGLVTAIRTRLGGMKNVLDEIYYPGFYEALRYGGKNRIDLIDEERLWNEFIERYAEGLPINKSHLNDSSVKAEGDLYRKSRTLMIKKMKEQGLKKKSKGEDYWTAFVSKKTGISEDDITVSGHAKNRFAYMGETFTSFLFHWAPLVGVEIQEIKSNGGKIYWGHVPKDKIFFFNGGQKAVADIRLNGMAVEVKNCVGRFNGVRLEDVVNRYSKGKKWSDNTPVKGSLVVFHSREDFIEDAAGRLEEEGIDVLTYQHFRVYLEKTLGLIKKLFPEVIEQARPRVHHLDMLLGLYDQLSLRPCVLMRPGNSFRMNYGIDVLTSLIEGAEVLKENAKKD